jgi:hypothetical protein
LGLAAERPSHGAIANMDEVSKFFACMASDDSSSFTGAILVLDGS